MKTWLAWHSFEVAYLGVLVILPFIVAIRVVATVLISFLLLLGLTAVVRRLTRKRLAVDQQTVVITGCDTGTCMKSFMFTLEA